MHREFRKKKSKKWLGGGRVPLCFIFFITSLRDDERVRDANTHTHTHNNEAQEIVMTTTAMVSRTTSATTTTATIPRRARRTKTDPAGIK